MKKADTAIQQHQEKFLSLTYDELNTYPQQVMRAIFEHCDLSVSDIETVLKAFESDSQAGTSFAQGEKITFTDEQKDKINQLLEKQEIGLDTSYRVKNTLSIYDLFFVEQFVSQRHADFPERLYWINWTPVQSNRGDVHLYKYTSTFLKCTPHTSPSPVKVEYPRINWLMGRVPVVRSAKYFEDEHNQFLRTEAVEGVALFDYEADTNVLMQKYAEAIRMFHDLPADDFPITRTIETQLSFVQKLLELNPSEERQQLYNDMLSLRPKPTDTVLCHGNPHHDHIIIHPDTGKIRTWISVGHVAMADRYTDLAIIRRQILGKYDEDEWGAFLQYYGLDTIDEHRLQFFELFSRFIP